MVQDTDDKGGTGVECLRGFEIELGLTPEVINEFYAAMIKRGVNAGIDDYDCTLSHTIATMQLDLDQMGASVEERIVAEAVREVWPLSENIVVDMRIPRVNFTVVLPEAIH